MNTTSTSPDRQFRKDLARWFAVGSVFYVLATFFPVGYLQPDQHFQTLEFAHVKINPVHEERMAWEYRARIRPWTQPYLYVAALRGLQTLGVDRPFVQDAAIRLVSGAVGITALVLFCMALAPWLPSPAQRRWLAIVFGLFWLFPYHFTRTSSEAAATVLLLLGLSALLLLRNQPQEQAPERTEPAAANALEPSPAGLVLCAICMGLMFNARYQTGFIVLAVALWLMLVQKTAYRQLALFGAVVLATVAAGLGIDAVGYGEFEWVPWNYLKVNVFEGRAATFGTSPWYHYLLFMLILPIGPVLLLAALVFWLRYPKNLFTWIMLSFILVHVALGHKEIRFLSPIAPLALAAFVFVIPVNWFAESRSGNPFTERGPWLRWAFYFFLACNIAGLLLVTLRPPRPAITAHQFIQRTEPDHFEFYSLGATPYRLHQTGGPRFEFYAPGRVTHHRLESLAQLPAVLEREAPVYFYHPDYKLPDSAGFDPVRERCTLLYRSLDPAWDRWDYPGWLRRFATSSIYRCD